MQSSIEALLGRWKPAHEQWIPYFVPRDFHKRRLNYVYNGVFEDNLADPPKPRRWTVIASGLLCGVLALVVIYTNRTAFSSPLAVVVVAAIGMTAVLLQVRFYNRTQAIAVHPPMWLNILGIVFAMLALFSDFLRLSQQAAEITALGAVGCFGISSALILHAFRKHRLSSK